MPRIPQPIWTQLTLSERPEEARRFGPDNKLVEEIAPAVKAVRLRNKRRVNIKGFGPAAISGCKDRLARAQLQKRGHSKCSMATRSAERWTAPVACHFSAGWGLLGF